MQRRGRLCAPDLQARRNRQSRRVLQRLRLGPAAHALPGSADLTAAQAHSALALQGPPLGGPFVFYVKNMIYCI